MPKPMVSDDVKRGRLVRLAIDTWDDAQYRFHTVHRSDTPLGPAYLAYGHTLDGKSNFYFYLGKR